MQKIDDLLVFILVVDCQSFTRAADELKLSRSLVSKKITELEARLGMQLLLRSTRSLSLTEAGRSLYQHCCTLKNTLLEIENDLDKLRGQPQGSLKVIAPFTFGQMYLTKHIQGFLKRYPDINMQLNFSDSQTNLIEEGYDLAIRIGTLKDSNYRSRVLGTTKLLTVASPQYLNNAPSLQHPSDLEQHNCLLYTNTVKRDCFWYFEDQGKELAIRVTGNYRSNNGLPLLEAAASGLGIACVPDFMVTQEMRQQLTTVLSPFSKVQHNINALYPANSKISLNTRLFIDYLVEHLTAELSA
ncbi:LysR family transcriptional regulator [Paraferrimonas sp. SM1919]|uniref:LysR family transcriptional regulator n=1 Tax=Paraferrimonas sp. SM1919 TaxID=2662263 RepID=UPI0013D75E8F|nr:LysR family transcriptional regulator [Paraferrimonas sp. SM1919]